MWLAPPAAAAGVPVHTILTPAELSRAAQLDVHRSAAFVTGRVVLRVVLGDRLGCLPREVVLDSRCRCGKHHGAVTVRASGRASGPWVSLTRTGPLVAVVVRDAGPVGVDLGSVRAVGAASLANVLPARADPTDRAVAVRWVRVESTLKMLGTGLRRDPADVHVDERGVGTVDGVAVARVLDLPGTDRAARDLAGADVVGAVAVGGASALGPVSAVRARSRDASPLIAVLAG